LNVTILLRRYRLAAFLLVGGGSGGTFMPPQGFYCARVILVTRRCFWLRLPHRWLPRDDLLTIPTETLDITRLVILASCCIARVQPFDSRISWIFP